MKNQIRAVEQMDLEVLTALYMSAYADEVWREKWQPDETYNRINEITSSPDAVALVYVENGEILGCILCELMSWHTGKQLEVKEIFVNPLHQKRGIGKLLMKQVETMVPDLGVSELFLWTKNAPRLTRFYEKCGYSIVQDTIQMSKKF